MSPRAYITAIALLLSLSTVAQVAVRDMRGLTREQIDSIVHPTVAAEGTHLVRADRPSHELGTLAETDAPVSRTFTLTNVSDKALRITRVHTTCGCTAATYDTTAIAPNGTTQVVLTYNPKNRPGTIDTDAFVYFEGQGNRPLVRLSLYGEVTDSDVWSHLPYTMGALRVKRTTATFSELPATGKPSVRIPCANSGNKALRLTSRMLPSYASFRTEPETIAPGAEADMVITIDVAKLPKQKGDLQFPLLIEGIGGRPSERTIDIIIKEINEDKRR